MGRLRQWHGPTIAGLIWAITAYLSLALRSSSGGMLLLWLPSGVAVVFLANSPRSGWPRYLAALFVADQCTSFLLDVPLANAIGLGIAQMAAAVICVSIGRRVLGHHRVPRTIWHLSGLFMAALVASAISTLIAAPFRMQDGPEQQVWWFLTMTLGMLVGTPIVDYVRQMLASAKLRTEANKRGSLLAVLVYLS